LFAPIDSRFVDHPGSGNPTFLAYTNIEFEISIEGISNTLAKFPFSMVWLLTAIDFLS